jgi:hypothetical protein
MMPRAHSLVNGSSSLKKGISVDSLLEKIPVNSDTRVGTTASPYHVMMYFRLYNTKIFK